MPLKSKKQLNGGKFLNAGEDNCIIQIGLKVYRILISKSDRPFEVAIANVKKEIQIKQLIRHAKIKDWETRYCFLSDEESVQLTYEDLKKYGEVFDDYNECLEHKGIEGEPESQILITYYKELKPVNDFSGLFNYVSKSVEMLHELKITHGDIHIGNILLDSEKNPVLIDWDRAQIWTHHNAEFDQAMQQDLRALAELKQQILKHQSEQTRKAEIAQNKRQRPESQDDEEGPKIKRGPLF